ncbi:MAG: phospholipase D-like domain-containing protein [Vicinamibacterales bacterium]
MRSKSTVVDGFQVFAVTGVNTISFAIAASATARKGLLGFAVERIDPTEHEQFFVSGFKVFKSLVPQPEETLAVSTHQHPVQSLVWDDFTAKPDREYTYQFHPLRGQPKNIDRSAAAVPITVRTEPLFSTSEHDVFFNRGVASSQAYVREFGNRKPDDPTLSTAEQARALQWLTRELDDAILEFIARAKQGDGLRCCFYEFRYLPVAKALKAAIGRGVDVQIVCDAKENGTQAKPGKPAVPAFPREDNLQTIKDAKLPDSSVFLREARPSAISHNKFMVLLQGASKVPVEVWTGSTNISLGGISGQTNVGHWIRNAGVAAQYLEYWNIMREDPGADSVDPGNSSAGRKKNAALYDRIEGITDVPTDIADIPQGITPVFSPRRGREVLDCYIQLLDSATHVSCITLAFGVNAKFKAALKDNTTQSPLLFLLLEKEDVPDPRKPAEFIRLNAGNNIYEAFGSFIDTPVYQWARETNTRKLGLNSHVAYIHSKFLLRDPLGADPIVVTGSANFSDASTNDNDENMVMIRGDRRVADIYFTEFNRLFNHYYFRSVMEQVLRRQPLAPQDASLFLTEDDSWLQKYKPGSLRSKRVAIFTKMAI